MKMELIKEIIEQIKDDYNLHDLSEEELKEKLYNSYVADLGRILLEKYEELE